MALFYFPKASNLALRNAWDPNYQELVISCNPNMFFYFDTGSVIQNVSASTFQFTSSWAVSSSYAVSASYASNAGGSGYTTPTFDQTSSTWTMLKSSDGTSIYNTKTIKNEPQQVIKRNYRLNNNSMSIWLHDLPATPYSVVLGCQPNSLDMAINYTKCGLVLADSSSYKILVWALQFATPWGVAFAKYNSTASYNSAYMSANVMLTSMVYFPPILLAMSDDGTTLTSSYSIDGGNFWSHSYVVSRTDWLTNKPNQVGMVIDSPMASAAPAWWNIFHYEERSPIDFVNLR